MTRVGTGSGRVNRDFISAFAVEVLPFPGEPCKIRPRYTVSARRVMTRYPSVSREESSEQKHVPSMALIIPDRSP